MAYGSAYPEHCVTPVDRVHHEPVYASRHQNPGHLPNRNRSVKPQVEPASDGHVCSQHADEGAHTHAGHIEQTAIPGYIDMWRQVHHHPWDDHQEHGRLNPEGHAPHTCSPAAIVVAVQFTITAKRLWMPSQFSASASRFLLVTANKPRWLGLGRARKGRRPDSRATQGGRCAQELAPRPHI
ncbi:MAG: hypothetical protein BWY85_01461 [Firmicutes bacterium ADurb.Bin506]|nr:MAG: hypothetical protein BWY85_01461 [Firmicutes bacterium ADurb.Bin506]